MVQVTPEPFNREEIDEMLDKKLNISEQIDAYTKSEDDAQLLFKADKSEHIDAYSKTEADALLDDKLNISDFINAYTKQEDNILLALKLNIIDQIDAYSKTETDALHDDKLNITDQIYVYSKTEADALLDQKLNISDQIDVYTKSEDDALLLLKDNKSELADYVNLGSAQTITSQKQFNIIIVASVSKQRKNDASIFFACGGDMLVSSLVNQTELQEVHDIASAKQIAYVFDIQQDLIDRMAIQDNVAKLIISDNLYIVDKQVVDYWWGGIDLKVLETEQPDMTNVITTLGTATGGDNAISDLSFSGNTLILAKKINFVTADYDQNISGSKTFTSTIHSVGIQVQYYDNLSVTQNDALLLLNAEKTELIDSYTKGEDDALLQLKADKTQLIDAYTKQKPMPYSMTYQTQAIKLMLTPNQKMMPRCYMKAHKTQLIVVYTKGETNNLLNNNADSGVSYTKGDDDVLLQLKADKTQLIDACTKGESINLLNNKTNSGVSYTKGQDDALLLLKANQSTTQTKTETDQLISQIEVVDVDLSGYMTLGIAQTITANKIYNNACQLVNSIDGMATITAGGTKPLSESAGAPTDLSNYYTKTQTYSKTDTDNKYVRLEGSIQQTITGRLKYVNPYGETYNETKDPVANTYLTMSEVDSKLTNFVKTVNNYEINGIKTFNANDNATGFVKTGKDDSSVLLAGGGDQLLSSFGGIEDLSSYAFSVMNGAVVQFKLIRIGNLYIFSFLAYVGNYNAGTFNPDQLVQADTAFATYIPFSNSTIDNGGYVMITHPTGLITIKSYTNSYIQCASATWFK
ncbi:MAG: hypothetical protein EZS28_002323 [Streblomastix strix]|uniref:Uncharacterized protein n=1 Tax=Streblomastix strix TaxID=222440 RepID=A0A5J4X6L4_9EUKA|nr:MAG: hypothetical protein EZS28_002323 [Streblomastix strix]